jgi:hypothetical protein
VALHLNVSVENERLARRATSFATAVHQVDSLSEGRVENVFVLSDFHLDVDRVERDSVCVGHEGFS